MTEVMGEVAGTPVHIVEVMWDDKGTDLYFTISDGGYLLHFENKGDLTTGQVADELGKLLHGLEKIDGRFNEFIKNPKRYRKCMTLITPLSVEDCKNMDDMYRMSSSERKRKLTQEMEKWAR